MIYADLIGALTVRGDITGGVGNGSGRIWSSGGFDKVTVLGDVLGGVGGGSGTIGGSGDIGQIRISGDLTGGLGVESGWIGSDEGGSIDKITIGGSVIGGGGAGSGRSEAYAIDSIQIGKNLTGGAGAGSGTIEASVIASTKISGSILGGLGSSSGAIGASSLGSVNVGKDVMAGEGSGSASIVGFVGIHSVKIGGTLEGKGAGSGSISAFEGSIGSITVGKGISNTGEGITEIYAARDIGEVVIKGDVTGAAYGTLRIRAGYDNLGYPSHESIGSISIKGNVTNFLIEAGLNGGGEINPDASIGSVKITGTLTSSSIVAGLGAGDDGFYGTDDDDSPTEIAPDVNSRIASILIGGAVKGTEGGTDSYGIFAQHIVSLKVNGAKQILTEGPINDTTATFLGETEDFRFVELPALPA